MLHHAHLLSCTFRIHQINLLPWILGNYVVPHTFTTLDSWPFLLYHTHLLPWIPGHFCCTTYIYYPGFLATMLYHTHLLPWILGHYVAPHIFTTLDSWPLHCTTHKLRYVLRFRGYLTQTELIMVLCRER